MIRHNTATGFVVYSDATLLHWHRRVQAWLPPGGHVEANEDPVQAVLREVLEETGLEVEIVPSRDDGARFASVQQLEPPRTLLVEDVYDETVGAHQHIDMIYFTRVIVAGEESGVRPEVPEGWRWVTADELREARALENLEGTCEAPPADVRVLGLEAIAAAGTADRIR